MAVPGFVFSDGDIAEIKLFCWANNSQLSVNVLHARVNQPLFNFDMAMLANAMGTQFAPILKSMMPPSAQFYGTGTKNVTVTPNPTTQYSGAGQGLGTDGTILLPTQTSGLISLKTGIAGRAYRGRVYIAFPSMNDNQSIDVPTNAYVASLTGIASYLKSNPTVVSGPASCNLTFGIYHRKPPVPGVKFTPLTDALASTIWATQRRRGEWGRKNTKPF